MAKKSCFYIGFVFGFLPCACYRCPLPESSCYAAVVLCTPDSVSDVPVKVNTHFVRTSNSRLRRSDTANPNEASTGRNLRKPHNDIETGYFLPFCRAHINRPCQTLQKMSMSARICSDREAAEKSPSANESTNKRIFCQSLLYCSFWDWYGSVACRGHGSCV